MTHRQTAEIVSYTTIKAQHKYMSATDTPHCVSMRQITAVFALCVPSSLCLLCSPFSRAYQGV